MKMPFKFPKITFSWSGIRAAASRTWTAVREFRLPLDLKDIESLDRRYYRLAIGGLVALIVFMFFVGLVAFGVALRGSEQTLVPDVRGIELAQALVTLQEKELYPRIALRITDNAADRGTILEQRPSPGSIVKAGRRINLVVSRGPIIDRVGNYVGQDLGELRAQLQNLYASGRPLITIRDPPIYVFDKAAPGVILDQKPLPDSEITGPIELELVVSRGPEAAKTQVPALVGLDFASAYAILEKAGLPIVATVRNAQKGERAGTIVSQSPAAGIEVPAASTLNLVATAPSTDQNLVAGVFRQDLPAYPYPLKFSLEAVKPTGERGVIFRDVTPGGKIAVPYAVQDGTVLIMSVLNHEVGRLEVRKR